MSVSKLTSYDIAINNGRVMDPQTKTDVLANVGINGGTVCAVVPPKKKLDGVTVIDASGMVVAPGFVDIHTHEDMKEEGSIPKVLPPRHTMHCFLLDGCTTMIGGNCGLHSYPIADFFNTLEQEGCLINYAGFCGHTTFRTMVGATDRYQAATPEQIEKMQGYAEEDMKAGALGVSFGIQYNSGASYEEMLALAKVAARYGGMTSSHARHGGISSNTLEGLHESIRLCRDSGVPHQYSHIGGMAAYGKIMEECLDAISEARDQGLKVSTDNMAYEGWMTYLGSSIFDEGLWEQFDIEPEDLETGSDVIVDGMTLMRKGDRFTQALFDKIRPLVLEGKVPDPWAIGHAKKPVENRMPHLRDFCCVASDGHTSLDVPSPGQLTGHPRIAGTFARFLGRHVRQEGLVDLMTGLCQCSTRPAAIVGMTNKGRVSVGADADIVIFNPETILDKSTYGAGFMEPPDGIEYVIVNGELAAKGKEPVPGIAAGKAIRRIRKIL